MPFFVCLFVCFFLEHNVGNAGPSNFFVLEPLPVYFPVKSPFVLQGPDFMQRCKSWCRCLGACLDSAVKWKVNLPYSLCQDLFQILKGYNSGLLENSDCGVMGSQQPFSCQNRLCRCVSAPSKAEMPMILFSIFLTLSLC